MTTDFVTTITSQLIESCMADVRRNTESQTRDYLLNANASEVLTFVMPSGQRIEPSVSREYVEALWCFARGKKYQDAELDSAITQPILKSTEDAIVEVLNSDTARDVIINCFTPNDGITGSVQEVVGSESSWIAREVLVTAGINPFNYATDSVVNSVTDTVHELLSSSAGKTILGSIAKVALTTQGKILLAKLISTIATKVAASAAMKVMVMGALKKVGIALLIKAVIVKVLATVAPALLAAKIPVFWIIAPIIGYLIYKELKNIPIKLADKIPPAIGAEIESTFPEIAHKFATMILADTIKQVAQNSGDQGPGHG